MLEPANLLKLAHALVGVLFVAGLVGRWLTLGHAAQGVPVCTARP